MPFRECKFVQLWDKDDIIPSTTLDPKERKRRNKRRREIRKQKIGQLK